MRLTKFISILGVISLLAVSCDLFGSTPHAVAGILRSANSGTDWQAANTIKDKPDSSLAGTNISGLKFKPDSSDVIFGSSYNNGMVVSEDGGNSWSQLLSQFAVYDFTFDPADPNVMYVAGIAADHGRVLVTRDTGKSWQEIYSEGTSGNGVRAIMADSNQRLYIGLEDGNMVRSEDSGLTWKLVKNFETRVNAIRSYNGSLYVLARSKGLFRSDDGQNFVNVTGEVGSEDGFRILSNVGTYNQFVITVGSIYLATNNGFFRSVDQGGHWTRLTLPVQDQSASILTVATSPTNDSLVYTAVGSTIYKSTDGGNTWQTQNSNTTSLITALLVHPQNPQLVYAGAFAQ
jgi:photosystem II stability/assembly factor-like uncharacterized protein